MKWKAIKQNGKIIQYINSPTEEMRLIAMKQNDNIIFNDKNKTCIILKN